MSSRLLVCLCLCTGTYCALFVSLFACFCYLLSVGRLCLISLLLVQSVKDTTNRPTRLNNEHESKRMQCEKIGGRHLCHTIHKGHLNTKLTARSSQPSPTKHQRTTGQGPDSATARLVPGVKDGFCGCSLSVQRKQKMKYASTTLTHQARMLLLVALARDVFACCCAYANVYL